MTDLNANLQPLLAELTADPEGRGYAALSQSRTLADGESLTVTYKLKQQ